MTAATGTPYRPTIRSRRRSPQRTNYGCISKNSGYIWPKYELPRQCAWHFAAVRSSAGQFTSACLVSRKARPTWGLVALAAVSTESKTSMLNGCVRESWETLECARSPVSAETHTKFPRFSNNIHDPTLEFFFV